MLKVRIIVPFLLLLVAMLVVVVSPVYLDDSVYAIILGRFLDDSWQRIFVFPVCPSSFSRELPKFLWPAAALTNLLYWSIDGLAALRIFGSTVALANAVFVYAILRRLLPKESRSRICLFLSVFMTGPLAFLLVSARPEGLVIMLYFLTVLLCVFRLPSLNSQNWLNRLATTVMLFMLITMILGHHPLGLFFFPAFVLFFFKSVRSRWLRGPFLMLLCFAAYHAAKLHISYYACEENPEIHAWLNNYAGQRTSAFDNIFSFVFERLTQMCQATFALFVKGLFFQAAYPFGQIPPSPGISPPILSLIGNGAVVVGIALLIWINLLGAKQLIADFSLREISSDKIIFIANWLVILLILGSQPVLLLYRLEVLFPLFILTSGVSYFGLLKNKALLRCETLLLYSSCTSALCLTAVYLPSVPDWLERAKFPDQSFSVGLLSQSLYREDIEEAVQRCDLKEIGKMSRIVVDPITYWRMRAAREPILMEYLFWGAMKNIEKESDDRIRRAKVQALFFSCDSSPPDVYLSGITRVGKICCRRYL